jgi:hypothetical protein
VFIALVTQCTMRVRLIYFHLWLVRLYHIIFLPYLINGTIFEKNITGCIRNTQHNAQICTTALFIYAGSYMFRQ